jgi:hypothetical protein
MSGAHAEGADPSASHTPGVQERARRTSRHGFRRKHNPCRVRYVYEPRLEVFCCCWILLTYPVMVIHISGLQYVSSVDRECVTTLVEYSPRYSDTNAVMLLPLCRDVTHHRWPPDVCVCFTSGCVPSVCVCVCVCCSYVAVCATVLHDANMIQWGPVSFVFLSALCRGRAD